MSSCPPSDLRAPPRGLCRSDEIIMDMIETVGGKDVENSERLIELVADRMARIAGNEDGGARRYGPLDAIDRDDGGALEDKINFRLGGEMHPLRSPGSADPAAGDEAVPRRRSAADERVKRKASARIVP